jgi:hypothetical protein
MEFIDMCVTVDTDDKNENEDKDNKSVVGSDVIESTNLDAAESVSA